MQTTSDKEKSAMKVYLVQGHNDPCSYFIGIFADKQVALEAALLDQQYLNRELLL